MPYVDRAITVLPSDDTCVWRYMTLEKFLYLIVKSKLHFCRSDKFTDKWENTWPEHLFQKYNLGSYPAVADMVEDEKSPRQTVNDGNRASIFLNCWHMNKHESAAMWDSYAKWESSIAIASTIRKLKTVLRTDRCYSIDLVRYVEIETYEDPSNQFVPYLFKRKSFEHENEVRAYIQDQPGFTGFENKSLDVDVDLPELVESVHISPTAPDYLVDVVKKIIAPYIGEEVPITKSSLYDEVVY